MGSDLNEWWAPATLRARINVGEADADVSSPRRGRRAHPLISRTCSRDNDSFVRSSFAKTSVSVARSPAASNSGSIVAARLEVTRRSMKRPNLSQQQNAFWCRRRVRASGAGRRGDGRLGGPRSRARSPHRPPPPRRVASVSVPAPVGASRPRRAAVVASAADERSSNESAPRRTGRAVGASRRVAPSSGPHATGTASRRGRRVGRASRGGSAGAGRGGSRTRARARSGSGSARRRGRRRGRRDAAAR